MAGNRFRATGVRGETGSAPDGALSAAQFAERERCLIEVYEVAATMQNALAATAPLDPAASLYHERPYRVIHAGRFATALADAIQDEDLRRIVDEVGLVGAVDQFVDCTDVLERADSLRGLTAFYEK